MPSTPPGSRDGCTARNGRTSTGGRAMAVACDVGSIQVTQMSLRRHLDSTVDFALKVGGTIQTQTSGGTTMAVLELTGPEGRDTIELVGERLTIGRSSDNDVVL